MNVSERAFIKEVSERIAEGKIVPFIGAGFSVYGGYPLWKDLLAQIIELCKKEEPGFLKVYDDAEGNKKLEKFDYQGLADYISDQGFDIRQRIRSIIGSSDTSLIEKYDIPLAQWNCKNIFTTNYDTYIETLLTRSGKEHISYTHKQAKDLFSTANGKIKVIHLHGFINDCDSMVFSNKDIQNKIIANEAIKEYITKYFIDRSFLFLGYSLGDPYLNEMFKFISNIFQYSEIKHYAILDCGDMDVKILKSNLSLSVCKANNFGQKNNKFLDILDKITHHLESSRGTFCLLSEPTLTEGRKADIERIELISKFKALSGIQKLAIRQKALLHLIVREGLRMVSNPDNKTFNIHLVRGKHMVVEAAGGANAESRMPGKIKELENGLIGMVYMKGLDSYYAENVAEEKDENGNLIYINMNPTTKSELIIPLFTYNPKEMIGVLNIESSEPADFQKEEDVEILKVVATQVAVALQNKKKYDNLKASLDITEAFFNNETLNQEAGNEYRLNYLLEKMAQALKFKRACVYCSNRETSSEFDNIITTYSIDEPDALKMAKEKAEKFKSIQNEVPEVEQNRLYCKGVLPDGRSFIVYFQDSDDAECEDPTDITDDERNTVVWFSRVIRHCIDIWERAKAQLKKRREFNLYQKLYTVMAEPNEDKFLKKAADIICTEFSVDWCYIFRRDPIYIFEKYPTDPAKDVYYLKALSGEIDDKELDKTEYAKGENITGSVALKNDIVRIENAFESKDPTYSGCNKAPFSARGITATSFLGVPIRKSSLPDMNHADICGILTTGRKRANDKDDKIFSQDEGPLLLKVASIIGKEIQLRDSLYSDEHHKAYIDLLQEAAMRFRACEVESDIYDILQELLAKHLKEEFHSVFKLNKKYLLEMVAPLKYKRKQPPTFEIGQGLTGQVIADRIPRTLEGSAVSLGSGKGNIIFTLNLSEGRRECREFWRKIIKTQERYFMGVPIIHPDNRGFYGVLTLNGRRPKHFNPEFYKNVTTKVVMAISSHITLALKQINSSASSASKLDFAK